jgi:hypothetical protein
MPPIEQSLRGSLLTGASALALSVSGYGAEAQVTPPALPPPPEWIVWVEGSPFQTAGGGMNVPTLGPGGFTAPFTSVGPSPGIEGAFGFDARLPNDPLWHFIFDFRYGASRTASTSTSSSHTFSTHFTHFKTFFSSTTTTSSSQTDWEREHHLVVDFMAGRDYALGETAGEIQFGIRIADLAATAWAQQSASTTTSFFSSLYGVPRGSGSSSSSETAYGTWASRFFGAGPRVAATGTVPLSWPAWSFDYEAGIAGLVGNRSFSYAVTVTPGGTVSGSTSAIVFVFNTDAWAGLSYALTPQVKLTGGIRADFYDGALTTYNVNTGGLEDLSRTYWGPFLRLTGAF